jgi:hypothetical protein
MFKRIDLNGRKLSIGLATAALMAIQLPIGATAANATSIKGNWFGSGTFRLQEGKTERFRCRVKYGRIAGQDFSVSARCATSGTRLDQTGQLTRISTNRYVGNLRNEQFNVSARVIVTVAGPRQTVSISSKHGTANIVLSRR